MVYGESIGLFRYIWSVKIALLRLYAVLLWEHSIHICYKRTLGLLSFKLQPYVVDLQLWFEVFKCVSFLSFICFCCYFAGFVIG